MSPRTSGTSPRMRSAPINKCRASATAMTSNGLRQTQTARSSSWAFGDKRGKGNCVMESYELILTILGSVGGTGVIIAGLSAWLGNVWAARIADVHKQALQLATTIDLDLRTR